MYYHHLILTIFEPALDAPWSEGGASPQQIVVDAKKNLNTLIRIYYLRHGYEAMDLFIVIPLMVAASECLESIGEFTPADKVDSLRSTLILVTKGLHTQSRNHYLAEALYRVVRGRMSPAEVALFRTTTKIHEDDAYEEPKMAQAIRSHWPVSVVKKKEDMPSRILKNLVERYAHLNTEDDRKATSS